MVDHVLSQRDVVQKPAWGHVLPHELPNRVISLKKTFGAFSPSRRPAPNSSNSRYA